MLNERLKMIQDTIPNDSSLVDPFLPTPETTTPTLEDRSSSEYKKAQMMNSLSRKEEPLQDALRLAGHLKDEQKSLFIRLADIYLSDMSNNIFKNQFQLCDDNTNTTIDEWQSFLSDKIVSVYIDKHKRTLLKTAAEDNLANPLAKNKRDSLKLIDSLNEKDKQDLTKNVVIIRLPNVYDD